MQRILIVDDELAIGQLLLYQLRECGYQALYEPDALRALTRIDVEQPDLVLLDVMMPLISGWELCRQIRAASDIPIIMLTAKSGDLDVATGLSAGADDYLSKPISIVQLQARIAAVLRRAARSGARPEARRQAHKETGDQRSADHETARPETRDPRPEIGDMSRAAGDTDPSMALLFGELPGPVSIGQRLHSARVIRGVSLLQAERACRVRWEFLQAIEQNNFEYVPRAQLRFAIPAYASYLGLTMADLSRPTGGIVRRNVPFHQTAALAAVLMLVVVVSLLFLVG